MLDHLLTGAPAHTRLSLVFESVARSMASASRWIELHRQRERLDELEEHQLADLGLTRAQVRKECLKWPWQH